MQYMYSVEIRFDQLDSALIGFNENPGSIPG